MNLEPYQLKAAQWLSKKKYGAVISPAGSGKTIIAAAALNMALLAKPRIERVNVGWIANTREQTDQARKALDLFPAIGNMANVEVACAQAQNDWSRKSVLIVDECHHVTAETWLDQVMTCTGAIWGFTATPKTGDLTRDRLFYELFQGNIFGIGRDAVKDRLAAARVIMLQASDDNGTEIDKAIEPILRQRLIRLFRVRPPTLEGLCQTMDESLQQDLPLSYIELVRRACHKDRVLAQAYAMAAFQVVRIMGIEQNAARNNAIIDAANRHAPTQPTLVLVNSVEHAKMLQDYIRDSRACYSKMGAKKRREAMEDFRSGKTRCLIATSLADEGLDLPMAEVLVLGSGGRSSAKTEQRTGRVLRAFAGKSEGIIYDFYDRQHPTMERQSNARQTLYRKLGYQFDQP